MENISCNSCGQHFIGITVNGICPLCGDPISGKTNSSNKPHLTDYTPIRADGTELSETISCLKDNICSKVSFTCKVWHNPVGILDLILQVGFFQKLFRDVALELNNRSKTLSVKLTPHITLTELKLDYIQHITYGLLPTSKQLRKVVNNWFNSTVFFAFLAILGFSSRLKETLINNSAPIRGWIFVLLIAPTLLAGIMAFVFSFLPSLFRIRDSLWSMKLWTEDCTFIEIFVDNDLEDILNNFRKLSIEIKKIIR